MAPSHGLLNSFTTPKCICYVPRRLVFVTAATRWLVGKQRGVAAMPKAPEPWGAHRFGHTHVQAQALKARFQRVTLLIEKKTSTTAVPTENQSRQFADGCTHRTEDGASTFQQAFVALVCLASGLQLQLERLYASRSYRG